MYHIDLIYIIVCIILIVVMSKADTTFEFIAYLLMWIGMWVIRNIFK